LSRRLTGLAKDYQTLTILASFSFAKEQGVLALHFAELTSAAEVVKCLYDYDVGANAS
jgi:hypothetical protein